MNETEKARLKEALHKMNNALNSITMQAELARMYAEQGDGARVQEALQVIMAQCRQGSSMTQGIQDLLDDQD